MTFTSLTFLLFFTGIFLLYWLAKGRRRQNVVLILASYAFYSWWDYRFCALMLISSLLDFGIGLALARAQLPFARRCLLYCSVAGNLSLLGIFKYYNFFAESFQQLTTALTWQVNFGTIEVILPVGISFYTFQTMGYTIDVYRRKLVPTSNLIDYLAFVSFFPQLMAGPIERAGNLLPQISRPRQFNYEEAKDGCRMILWGFLKKLVIADRLAVIVDAAFASPDSTPGPQLALAAMCFLFQIYCDFSAYSDIAIGTAKLFHIKLMRNFAYPFFSQSLTEFWRRWHISLSSWFRDYVFMPLAERRSRVWALAFLVFTFVLSGLWHGAGWTFLVWGGLNGLLVAGEIVFFSSKSRRKSATPGGDNLIPHPVTMMKILLTFGTASLLAVFFRAQSITDATVILTKIASQIFWLESYGRLAEQITSSQAMSVTLIALSVFVLAEWVQKSRPHPLRLEHLPTGLRWFVYTSAIWVGLLLMPTTHTNPFIYFQF